MFVNPVRVMHMIDAQVAIKNYDIETIKSIIKGGFDVNTEIKNGGITSLMFAAAHGRKEITKLLIEEGADVNAKDATGKTALMWALHYDLEWTVDEMVVILITKGADVNAKDDEGKTALSLAKDRLDPNSYHSYYSIKTIELLEAAEAKAQAKKEAAEAKAQVVFEQERSEGDVKIEGEEGMKDGDA